MLPDTSSQCPNLSSPCTVAKLSGSTKQLQKKKEKEKENRKVKKRKISKVPRLHGSTFKYWEFLVVAERSSWLRGCRYISLSAQGFKKKNSTMLHLYLIFKIENLPLGSGLVYILGRGYDSWVIRVNAVCLYWHWMKTVKLAACVVCP